MCVRACENSARYEVCPDFNFFAEKKAIYSVLRKSMKETLLRPIRCHQRRRRRRRYNVIVIVIVVVIVTSEIVLDVTNDHDV